MENKKKLIKNTAIYALGNFGSKILSYIMVLVYSHYIHAKELGYYDLILTTVGLVIPIVVLGINEAIYRFMVDNKQEEKEKIISTSFRFLFFVIFIICIVFVSLGIVFNIRYWMLILVYGVSTLMLNSIQESIRGFAFTRFYASIGVINSLITLALEYVGLVYLHKGIEALLYGKIIANIICILIGGIKAPIFMSIIKQQFNRTLLRELLSYSIPLVPNIICWWIMNASDRYIIRIFLGTGANGVYAIANKFPTILASITSVFYLAWQESAIKLYNEADRDKFISNIFNQYFKLLFSLCILLIPATKFVVMMFLSEEYGSAWIYSSILFIASAFGAICSFLGIGYQISKETIRSLYTTAIAASINFAVNILFIRSIGLNAASLSTLAAYILLFIIRVHHTRRYYSVKYNKIEMMLLLFANAIICIVTYLLHSKYTLLMICFIALAVVCYLNKELVMPILRKVIKNARE